MGDDEHWNFHAIFIPITKLAWTREVIWIRSIHIYRLLRQGELKVERERENICQFVRLVRVCCRCTIARAISLQ